MLDSIEQLINERNSGFGVPEDLTELEKELIVLWDRNVAANERAMQRQIAEGLAGILAMAKSRS